jgi:hypothetical protein
MATCAEAALPIPQTNTLTARLPRLATFAAVSGVVALLVVISQSMPFDHDEIEHVHAAWHVSVGRVPYRDFFQNHHPLFWYLLAPALGSNPWPTDLLAIRGAFLLCTLGIAAATFQLAREATSSSRIAWTAVVLLLTCTTFARGAIEVRSDVPFALAATVGYLFFARAIRLRRGHLLCASGLALALGLLFHQKAVVVVGVLAVIGAGEFRGREIRRLAWLVAPALVAVAVLAAWFAGASALHDYWAMAWVFPSAAATGTSHHGYGQLAAGLTQNAPFWLAALAGMVAAWRRPEPHRLLGPLALAAGLLLISFVAAGRLFNQYFLPAWPLLAVLAAATLANWADRGPEPGRRLVVAAGLVMLVPVVVLLSWTRPANGGQIERMVFVTASTPAGGAVYDGDNRLNPFRDDVHHFWYMAGREPETSVYNRIAGPARTPYDGCAAIRRRRPRVISDFQIDLAACGLFGLYRAVLPGIYLRTAD